VRNHSVFPFYDEYSRVVHAHVLSSLILTLIFACYRIKLSVGGRIFITTLLTLQSDPDSMLTAMFSGPFALDKMSDDENMVFIDRPGSLFERMLSI